MVGKSFFKTILLVGMLAGRALCDPLPAQEVSDTTGGPQQKFDSVAVRAQFVIDSLMAREQFIQDSIRLRQRRLDSLFFLRGELQELLGAYFRTTREDIILRDYEIEITGDTALGDFIYFYLPFSVSQPYIPWKVRAILAGTRVKLVVDTVLRKITSIQTPQIRCSFAYGNPGGILVIHEQPVVQNNWAGHFYRMPFDSLFFDRQQRIVKIKRYVQFYSVVRDNQRGSPLFLNLSLVKQFTYGKDNRITQYQVVKFCDRWNAFETGKVCSIINYSFTGQDSTLRLSRRNDPANPYSDGTFTYEFDSRENLKSISFENLSKTENWQRSVELNSRGHVNCYFDKTNGIIRQSICFIYHLDDPLAGHPVETITTVFEKDGISYFQRNNTTGRSRTRDRMTLEWSPWK
jgi:hypothetical protein